MLGRHCCSPWASDVMLDTAELQRERALATADVDDVRRVAVQAHDLGVSRAAQWCGKDLLECLGHAGVVVSSHKCSPDWSVSGVEIAAYTTRDASGHVCLIDLFEDVIERKVQGLAAFGVDASMDLVKDLHLAHEFYHYLEFSQLGLTCNSIDAVQVRGLFGRKPHHPSRAGEVAAHAFARACIGFPFHPVLIVVMSRMGAQGAEFPVLIDDFVSRMERI